MKETLKKKIPTITEFNVNWEEGMMLSRQRMLELENSTQDRMRDTFSFFQGNFQYGLLPTAHKETVTWKIESDTIKIFGVSGITKNGYRIELPYSEDEHFIDKTLEEKPENFQNKDLYVVLSVGLFKEQAFHFGGIDDEEDIRDHRFALPGMQIVLKPKDKGEAIDIHDNELIIGKLREEDGKILIDEEYIPPCAFIDSSSRIREENNKLIEWIGLGPSGLIRDLTHIIKIADKYLISNKSVTEEYHLNFDLKQFAEKILAYISATKLNYSSICTNQSPVFLINYYKSLAGVFSTAVECASKKERVIEYFKEQQLPKGLITNIDKMEYEHHHVANSLQQVVHFREALTRFFNLLGKKEEFLPKRDRKIWV